MKALERELTTAAMTTRTVRAVGAHQKLLAASATRKNWDMMASCAEDQRPREREHTGKMVAPR